MASLDSSIIFNNRYGLDEYLEGGGTEEDVVRAVEEKLNPYAEDIGMKPLTGLDYPTAMKYLGQFWYLEGTDADANDSLIVSADTGLSYMIPYLYWRYLYIKEDIGEQAIYLSARRGYIASVEALLGEGISMYANENGLMEVSLEHKRQDIVDLLLSRGYLEKAIPTEVHYQRRSEWPRYPLSQRPMTYMTQMCKRIGAPEPVHLYLPVLRYQSLYHPEVNKRSYCGTFYFFDPESIVLLDLGRTAVFGSKFHALYVMNNALQKMEDCRTFLNQIPYSRENMIRDLMSLTGWQDIYKLHPDMSTEQFFEQIMVPYYYPILRNEEDVKVIPRIETTVLYPTDESKYWTQETLGAGTHDYIDQVICRYARQLGIDTLIIQREIGEYRAVTEILDTRSDSYSRLVRVEGTQDWYKPSSRYPTIWFTDQGFISNGGITHDFNIDPTDSDIVKTHS